MKIFDKKSMSVSMVFKLDGNENFDSTDNRITIVKLCVDPSQELIDWIGQYYHRKSQDSIQDMMDGLEGIIYESSVYDYISDKNVVNVLKTVGRTYLDFPDMLAFIKEGNRNVFCCALYKYLTNLFDDKVKYDLDKDMANYIKNKVEIDSLLNKFAYHCIILPSIDGHTYEDVIKGGDYDDLANDFGKILKGIQTLYKNMVIHNDLHAGNILIDKAGHAFIYDFDRSYIKGRPNPCLSDKADEKLCAISSCNVYNKTHVIDFFKILGVVSMSPHFERIFSLVVPLGAFKFSRRHLVFTMDDGTSVDVKELLQKANKNFFSYFPDEDSMREDSYLQFYNNNPEFKKFVQLMGKYDTIVDTFFVRYKPKAGFGFKPDRGRKKTSRKSKQKYPVRSLGSLIN